MKSKFAGQGVKPACRRKTLLVIALSLFFTPAVLSAASDDWVPMLGFCQTNRIQLSFNLNRGFVDMTRGSRTARVFLTVPYIASGGRAYLMQSRIAIGAGGEVELPGEYAARLTELLVEGQAPAGTNRIVGYQENFVNPDDPGTTTTTVARRTNAVTIPVTTTTVPLRTNPSNSAQNGTVSYNTNDAFQPITAVVIDPGHGGRDPGGMSQLGLKEKDIVLAVCKQLKVLFAQGGRFSATMTRSSDVFVTLEDRTKIARGFYQRHRAVFVSVHANISLDTGTQGVEVYSLSDRPSDNEALDVEKMENAGFDRADIAATQDLYSVIADLVNDGIRIESEKLARTVYDSVTAATGAQKRGVKQAGFYVLKYNSAPSVLVEIGFLSNPSEAKRLNTTDYQKKLAQGIYNGIVQFIDNYNRTRGFSR